MQPHHTLGSLLQEIPPKLHVLTIGTRDISTNGPNRLICFHVPQERYQPRYSHEELRQARYSQKVFSTPEIYQPSVSLTHKPSDGTGEVQGFDVLPPLDLQ